MRQRTMLDNRAMGNRTVENTVLENAIRGSLAGAVATVGMTAVMVMLHRRLPRQQRYGLPPEQIVDEVLQRAEVDAARSQPQFEALAMTAHHAYGCTMGAVYGVLPVRWRLPPLASGVGFGMLVWAAGYLGWLPALRMDASATREPLRRNGMTIASHVVWGALTGLLAAAPKRHR